MCKKEIKEYDKAIDKAVYALQQIFQKLLDNKTIISLYEEDEEVFREDCRVVSVNDSQIEIEDLDTHDIIEIKYIHFPHYFIYKNLKTEKYTINYNLSIF